MQEAGQVNPGYPGAPPPPPSGISWIRLDSDTP